MAAAASQANLGLCRAARIAVRPVVAEISRSMMTNVESPAGLET